VQRNVSASNSKPDSFASLTAFSGIKGTHQVAQGSLEQQRLAREKEKREASEKEKKNLDLHFGDNNNEFWEKHSRTATPTITTTDTYIPPFDCC